jgi:hypothetical protein
MATRRAAFSMTLASSVSELSAQVAESDGLLAHDRLLPVWQTFDDVITTLSD